MVLLRPLARVGFPSVQRSKLTFVVAEIKKQEQIAFIVTMVTALVGFVPFMGTGVRAAGLVTAGRILTYVGETAQVALNLYALQQDPTFGGNIMFVMIDYLTIALPRWNLAAGAFATLRAKWAYRGLSGEALSRAQRIDRTILPNHRYK